MSRFCVLICRIDDEQEPDRLVPVQRVDVPAVPQSLPADPDTLDVLEEQALGVGQEVTRQLISSQWQQVDARLVEAYQALFPPRPGLSRRR